MAGQWPRRIRMTSLKAAGTALALLAASPIAAKAGTVDSTADLALSPPAAQPDLMRRGYYPGDYYGRRQPDARQGLLLSFGLGGGSLYLSDRGPGRIGAADIDFRLGYGFSDRFQMFMD